MINLTEGQNWFDGQKHNWEKIVLPEFEKKEYCRALEVGSWEGGSACWILSNLCGGSDQRNHLTCIDHFDLFQTTAGKKRWQLFNENLQTTGLKEKTRIISKFSIPALFELMYAIVRDNEAGFDLVYIDASHRSDDTLLDAELAWRMAVRGCIIIFDDYEWDQQPEGTIEHPKNGIDSFLKTHENEYTLLHQGYQVIVRKEVPLRVGFVNSD